MFMGYYIGAIDFSLTDELRHHGILGMKWGVRRYQNKDGTLTAAGKERYGIKNETYNGRRALKYAKEHLSKKNDRRSFSTLYGDPDDLHKYLELGKKANEQEASGIDATKIAHDFAKEILGDYADVKISDVVKLPKDKQYYANKTLAKLIEADQEQMQAAAKIDTSDLTEAQKRNFELLVTRPWWEIDKEIGEKSGDWYNGKGVSLKFKKYMEDYEEADHNYYNSDEKLALDKEEDRLWNAQETLRKSYTGKYVDANDRITDEKKWDEGWRKAQNSKEMKKLKADMDEVYKKQRELKNKYFKDFTDEKLCEIVLRDLGYTPTKAAIEYIMPIVIWD